MTATQKNLTRLIVCAAMVGALFVVSTPARAQASGSVSVDIDFPSMLILYYHGDMQVTIPAASLGNVLTGGAGDTVDLADTVPLSVSLDGSLDNDVDMTVPALTGDPSSLQLSVRRSWAVRSVGPAAGATEVEVVVDQPFLTRNSSALLITGVQVAAQSQTGSLIQFAPQGLASPVRGDLLINVDASAAAEGGLYTGGQFTITARSL